MFIVYEAVLSPCETGVGYEVELPDFGMATYGSDVERAAKMAYDAMVNAAVVYLQEGMDLPKPVWNHEAPAGGLVLAVCADVDPADPEDPLLDASEAASILGITEVRVCALLRAGLLKGFKEGGRWKVRTDSVRERLNSPRKGGRPRKSARESLPPSSPSSTEPRGSLVPECDVRDQRL